MKIILLQDDKKLGKKGDVVEVAEAYARNVVLAKKIGIEATSKNLNDAKLQKANSDKLAAEQLEAAKELAIKIEKEPVVVKIKAGEKGKTFGSVSSKEIALALKEQFGYEVDKKKIVLSEAIKTFGTHDVVVKLHTKVSGTIHVKVQEA